MNKINIITYASGYKIHVYKRFMKTLMDTGFKGNVYLITKSKDIDNVIKIKLEYNNIIHFIDNNNFTNANNQRYFAYLNILKKNLKCKYILICDFRDILFQKNIENFNFDENIDLYGFLECKKIYEEKKSNVPWLKIVEKILGKQFLNKISHNYIICSGTTIGTVNGIKIYLQKMCNIILKIGIFKNCILDQGIHNYLIYMNELPLKIKLLDNNDNLINTVGIDKKNINEEGYILNNKKEVSFIIHQYDRFSKEHLHILNNKYKLNFS